MLLNFKKFSIENLPINVRLNALNVLHVHGPRFNTPNIIPHLVVINWITELSFKVQKQKFKREEKAIEEFSGKT